MLTENLKIGDQVRDKYGNIGEVIELHGNRYTRCNVLIKRGNNSTNDKIIVKQLWYIIRTLEII